MCMRMIDFDIANCKYNLTQCTFNVTVLTCKSEMYSHYEQPKCHVIQNGTISVMSYAAAILCKPKVRLLLPCYEEEVCVCGV